MIHTGVVARTEGTLVVVEVILRLARLLTVETIQGASSSAVFLRHAQYPAWPNLSINLLVHRFHFFEAFRADRALRSIRSFTILLEASRVNKMTAPQMLDWFRTRK